MFKDTDPLKSKARVAFNFPAKGRRGEHHQVATDYLKERVSVQVTSVRGECLLALTENAAQCSLKVARALHSLSAEVEGGSGKGSVTDILRFLVELLCSNALQGST